MTIKTVYASNDREAKVASRPTNSIAAAAATAWTLDVSYRAAQAERLNPSVAKTTHRVRPVRFSLNANLNV
jgi:hypothetical protein